MFSCFFGSGVLSKRVSLGWLVILQNCMFSQGNGALEVGKKVGKSDEREEATEKRQDERDKQKKRDECS